MVEQRVWGRAVRNDLGQEAGPEHAGPNDHIRDCEFYPVCNERQIKILQTGDTEGEVSLANYLNISQVGELYKFAVGFWQLKATSARVKGVS